MEDSENEKRGVFKTTWKAVSSLKRQTGSMLPSPDSNGNPLSCQWKIYIDVPSMNGLLSSPGVEYGLIVMIQLAGCLLSVILAPFVGKWNLMPCATWCTARLCSGCYSVSVIWKILFICGHSTDLKVSGLPAEASSISRRNARVFGVDQGPRRRSRLCHDSLGFSGALQKCSINCGFHVFLFIVSFLFFPFLFSIYDSLLIFFFFFFFFFFFLFFNSCWFFAFFVLSLPCSCFLPFSWVFLSFLLLPTPLRFLSVPSLSPSQSSSPPPPPASAASAASSSSSSSSSSMSSWRVTRVTGLCMHVDWASKNLGKSSEESCAVHQNTRV